MNFEYRTMHQYRQQVNVLLLLRQFLQLLQLQSQSLVISSSTITQPMNNLLILNWDFIVVYFIWCHASAIKKYPREVTFFLILRSFYSNSSKVQIAWFFRHIIILMLSSDSEDVVLSSDTIFRGWIGIIDFIIHFLNESMLLFTSFWMKKHIFWSDKCSATWQNGVLSTNSKRLLRLSTALYGSDTRTLFKLVIWDRFINSRGITNIASHFWREDLS